MTNNNAYPPAQGNLCWGVWESFGTGNTKSNTSAGSSRPMKPTLVDLIFGRFDFSATVVLNDPGDGFSATYVDDQEICRVTSSRSTPPDSRFTDPGLIGCGCVMCRGPNPP